MDSSSMAGNHITRFNKDVEMSNADPRAANLGEGPVAKSMANETDKDRFLVRFEKDDPKNPKNFSLWKRSWMTLRWVCWPLRAPLAQPF